MWAGAPWGCAVVGCPPLNVERQRNRGFSQFVQEFVHRPSTSRPSFQLPFGHIFLSITPSPAESAPPANSNCVSSVDRLRLPTTVVIMADASCPGIVSNPDLVGIGVSRDLQATPSFR